LPASWPHLLLLQHVLVSPAPRSFASLSSHFSPSHFGLLYYSISPQSISFSSTLLLLLPPPPSPSAALSSFFLLSSFLLFCPCSSSFPLFSLFSLF